MSRPLAGKLHLPFIGSVLETTGHPDPDLLRWLMFGVSHAKSKEAEFKLRDLVENRVAFRDGVYSVVLPSELLQDLMDCAKENSEKGHMTKPQKVGLLEFTCISEDRSPRVAVGE